MPLNPVQKAVNRARRIVRDGAYRQRSQALTRALAAAEASEQVLEAKRSYDEADQTCQRAWDARESKAREISAQIEALQSRLDDLLVSTNPGLEELHKERRAQADLWLAKRRAAAEEVRQQFPDLAGPAQFSAAAWQPPAEVLAEMEAAAQAAEAAEAPAAPALRDHARGS